MRETVFLFLGVSLLLAATGATRELPRPPAPPSDGSGGGRPISSRATPAASMMPAAPARSAPEALAAAPAADGSPRIHGTVVDDRGIPVAGVRVAVDGADGELAAMSDGGGRVVLPAVPGGYDVGDCLYLGHPEYAGTRFELPAGAAAGRDPFEAVLPRGAVLRGFVVDEEGAPVAGAVVKVGTDSGWLALFGWQIVANRCVRTDPRGEFEVRGLPAEALRPLFYREADPGRDALPWVGPEARGRPGEVADVGRFVARAPGGIRGRAVDRFGRPVAAVTILAIPEPCGLYFGVAERSVETGEDGTFALPDLPPGGYVLGRRTPDILHNEIHRLDEVVVPPGRVTDVEVVHPPRR